PQIRNVATLAGNICQRPWCWYYRNGFRCLKNGGTTCFSVAGENQFHAIFGGGPSYIVHPSDTAPALVALDATFRIAGPAGERVVPAADFFTLPAVDAARENILKDGEVLAEIVLPQRAHRARRRRTDPVTITRNRNATRGPAHHAGARREGGRGGDRRRAPAREERLQGAAHARDGGANAQRHCGARITKCELNGLQ